ncbi:hypothetical protein BN12_10027 [Nostocoides japonicum T1-X7]|uniref:Uncharacterized protein n=1 Tax=Nostocoides japonicum T1-X7 TaxID=1194083 RepID=A0A077LV45_9MICO|nr:hypothetical protein BN12_10027 [Tetrasphaera japonica T1-X7]
MSSDPRHQLTSYLDPDGWAAGGGIQTPRDGHHVPRSGGVGDGARCTDTPRWSAHTSIRRGGLRVEVYRHPEMVTTYLDPEGWAAGRGIPGLRDAHPLEWRHEPPPDASRRDGRSRTPMPSRMVAPYLESPRWALRRGTQTPRDGQHIPRLRRAGWVEVRRHSEMVSTYLDSAPSTKNGGIQTPRWSLRTSIRRSARRVEVHRHLEMVTTYLEWRGGLGVEVRSYLEMVTTSLDSAPSTKNGGIQTPRWSLHTSNRRGGRRVEVHRWPRHTSTPRDRLGSRCTDTSRWSAHTSTRRGG